MKKKNPEYIYRFPIDDGMEMPMHNDPLIELFSEQIRNILEICVLTHNGMEVKVDGFQFMNDRMRNHFIYPKRLVK
jgi:hypothetical protein